MFESFALPAGRYMIGDLNKWLPNDFAEVIDHAQECEFSENEKVTFLILNDFADVLLLSNAKGMEPTKVQLPTRNLVILPACMSNEVPAAPWSENPLILNTTTDVRVNINNLSVEVIFDGRILFIDGHNVY